MIEIEKAGSAGLTTATIRKRTSHTEASTYAFFRITKVGRQLYKLIEKESGGTGLARFRLRYPVSKIGRPPDHLDSDNFS